MDEILAEAKRLAALLATNERTKALRTASAAVTGDPDAKQLEEDYAHAAAELRELETTGAPIEPEMKRRMATLGERIRRSTLLQALLQANAEFADMMDGVQHEISDAVGQALSPDPGADSGTGGEPVPEKPSGPVLWTP